MPVAYAGLISTSSEQPDVFSFLSNPAAISFLKAASCGFFAEQRFLVPGLAYAGVGLGLPFKKQAAGLDIRYLGMPQSGTTEAGLSVSQKLGAHAAAGLQFRYRKSHAAGYAATQSLDYTLGAVGQLATGFYFGISVTNLHLSFTPRPKDFQETMFRLNLGSDISKDLFLGFSLEQASGLPPQATAVLQYRIVPYLLTRFGAATGNRQVFFGCGYLFKNLRLDVYTSLHPQLGFSPGVQLMFQSKAKE